MKTILYAILSTCLLLTSARAGELPQATPQEVGMSAEKLDKVRSITQAAVDKNQTAGVVVLVARRGKIVRVEAVGKTDVKAGTAMTPDAIFRIYSMTKPITSVAALMLVEEGKFALDDPVSKYLPEFKGLRVHASKGDETVEAAREMTIRDLMRHTSGLTYGMPNGTAVDKLYITNHIASPGSTLADMVSKLGKLPLAYQPGTHFNYSYSTDVLGRLIEVTSGKRLDEFLQERILKPLDMHDTGFFVPAEKLSRFTTSYHSDGKGTLRAIDSPATSPYRRAPKFLSGGGGLMSRARDYARFCQMLLSGGELQGVRLLRPETVRDMITNQLPAEALPMNLGGFRVPDMGFGLGVSVLMNEKTSRQDAGEFGWSGAASTFFWVAPKSELIVIVLQQIQPLNIGLQMSLRPAIYAAIQE